jgi:type VI secretion system secreted protein Hcp
MDRLRASAKTLVLIAAVMLVAAGTLAIASIPGGDGVFTGCWDHNTDTSHFGTLRVIDPSLPASGHSSYEYSCQSTETKITWNQQGPAGPTGPVGPAGSAGPAGAQGPQGAARPFTLLSFGTRGNALFLALPGVKGESTEKGHKDEIELVQMSVGGASTGGATRTHSGEFVIKKSIDKSSPVLFKACATGKHFVNASLTVRKAGGKQFDYLKFNLKDVVIATVTGAPPSGGKPAEQLTLSFTKLSEQFLGNHHTSINLTPNQFAGG